MRNCQNREKHLKSNDDNDKMVELLNAIKSEINGESNKLAVNKAHLSTSWSSLDKDNTTSTNIDSSQSTTLANDIHKDLHPVDDLSQANLSDASADGQNKEKESMLVVKKN